MGQHGSLGCQTPPPPLGTGRGSAPEHEALGHWTPPGIQCHLDPQEEWEGEGEGRGGEEEGRGGEEREGKEGEKETKEGQAITSQVFM